MLPMRATAALRAGRSACFRPGCEGHVKWNVSRTVMRATRLGALSLHSCSVCVRPISRRCLPSRGKHARSRTDTCRGAVRLRCLAQGDRAEERAVGVPRTTGVSNRDALTERAPSVRVEAMRETKGQGECVGAG